MLDGIIIFQADTGALVYQRKFVKCFGLPGAARQPAIADPVGLALQLYAFNRFSSDTPGIDGLKHLQLTPEGGGIFLKRGLVPDPNVCPCEREVPVVLAVLGRCLTREVGRLLATELFNAFAAEQRATSESTALEASTEGVPAATKALPPKIKSGVNGSARRGGGAAAAGAWRFRTLDSCLDLVVPDVLVAAVVQRLSRSPRWLGVVSFDSDAQLAGCSVAMHTATAGLIDGDATTGAASAPPPKAAMANAALPIPHPPRASPPEDRPTFARRMLLRLSPRARSANDDKRSQHHRNTDGKVAEETASLVPRAASAGPQRCPSPRNTSQLFHLPRWRRYSASPRSVSADGASTIASASTAPPLATLEAQVASCCCYMYGDPPAGERLEMDTVAQFVAAVRKGATSACAVGGGLMDRGWASLQLTAAELPWPSSTAGEVAVFAAGRRLVVTMPLEALKGQTEIATAACVCIDFRRCAHAELNALAAYFDFLTGLKGQSDAKQRMASEFYAAC